MIIKILAIVFYDLYIKTCPEFHFSTRSCEVWLIHIQSLSMSLYHQNHFRTRQPEMTSLIKFIDASVVSELLSGVLGHSEEGLDTCWTLSSELFDDLDGMHKIFA